MRYNPKFKIWLDNNVLIAMVKGSWSQQDAEDFAQEFKAVVTPLLGDDWASVMLLDNWHLGVPGIEPVIKDLVRWKIARGLRYSAHVYWPSTVKEFQLDKMVQDVNSRFELQKFKQPQQAFDWLETHGFNTDNQQKLAVD
ncbi:hypothetical protein SAMN06297280_3505 [Arsukibacterium tuosuense]|uniref:STAS/SEC14 domain-containing protein n=1 Tax=Arsukibacterium tuosuense TaxID=1323745 RepID=A0A285JEZ6_9GAMM|nr:hypothetical protein [Arsukibacterium tuosuense]SNY58870.1 hypothetical protein SAMN06297280_3505 [Arsukibacterium tuosuense]